MNFDLNVYIPSDPEYNVCLLIGFARVLKGD